MQFASINPCTLIDYPDTVAAILFTAGCNFRCGYCHNPTFVDPDALCKLSSSFLTEEAVINFLKSRIGLLEGVVICGGEPTIHRDLKAFIRKIKAMGFLVKLDTNGSNPQILIELLQERLVDYIAMDVKASEKNYQRLVGKNSNISKIRESISIIMYSSVPYEFRTTVLPEYHSYEDIYSIGRMIKGADTWALQQFRNILTLDQEFQKKSSYTIKELEALKPALGEFARNVEIRH